MPGNIIKLDKTVKKAKMDRKWRQEYMTLYMRDLENIEIGKEEGRKEGRQEEREDGIKILIETCQEFGESEQDTISRIQARYSISGKEAKRYAAKYWIK